MLVDYRIQDIFPRFILEDRDGYALCKALEAGLNYFMNVAEAGVKLIQDVETMPEWRLDEMAWELNCLYDYKADVSVKRAWIRDAYQNYRIHGTSEGIRQYVARYFGDSEVEEFWQFGGNPGQFNVAVTGMRSEEAEKWIKKAAKKAKNVRSELLNIIYRGGESRIALYGHAATVGVDVIDRCKML